jgi:hypothetical protein
MELRYGRGQYEYRAKSPTAHLAILRWVDTNRSASGQPGIATRSRRMMGQWQAVGMKVIIPVKTGINGTAL